MPASPAPAWRGHLRVLPTPDLARTTRFSDGWIDHDPSIPQSVPQSIRPSIPRSFSPSAARLGRWLETWCLLDAGPPELGRAVEYTLTLNPRQQLISRFDPAAKRAAFYGARALLTRNGPHLILRALHDMTYWQGDLETGYRCWHPAILSPARYLNWYVRQIREARP